MSGCPEDAASFFTDSMIFKWLSVSTFNVFVSIQNPSFVHT